MHRSRISGNRCRVAQIVCGRVDVYQKLKENPNASVLPRSVIIRRDSYRRRPVENDKVDGNRNILRARAREGGNKRARRTFRIGWGLGVREGTQLGVYFTSRFIPRDSHTHTHVYVNKYLILRFIVVATAYVCTRRACMFCTRAHHNAIRTRSRPTVTAVWPASHNNGTPNATARIPRTVPYNNTRARYVLKKKREKTHPVDELIY